VGALLFGASYQSVQPAIMAIANLGDTTLPALLNVDLWGSILLFVLIAVTMFYFLERHGELRRDKLEEAE
jgi:hypothetical protein